MNLRSFSLTLALCLLPALHARADASGARAAVTQKVRQVDLYAAARVQLVSERAALQQKSARLNAAVAQAKQDDRGVVQNAALQELLRNALEASKQLEATDRKLALLDRMMRDTVGAAEGALAEVPASQRATARAEVEHARGQLPAAVALSGGSDVKVNAGMDREALMERADLAGDYLDKLTREAERTEARLRELQGQASMVSEAQNLAMDRRLFDEEDRTLQATRVVGRTTGGATASDATRGNGATAAGNGTATGGAPDDARTESANQDPSAGFGSMDNVTAGAAGNAPPPAGAANAPDTTRGASAAASMTGMGRSQTVVDQRVLVLLREGRPTPGSLTPEDEVTQLQARREALLKAAARMRALREELKSRAGQSAQR